jgi:ferredoxin
MDERFTQRRKAVTEERKEEVREDMSIMHPLEQTQIVISCMGCNQTSEIEATDVGFTIKDVLEENNWYYSTFCGWICPQCASKSEDQLIADYK